MSLTFNDYKKGELNHLGNYLVGLAAILACITCPLLIYTFPGYFYYRACVINNLDWKSKYFGIAFASLGVMIIFS
jgi:hypothetical protein